MNPLEPVPSRGRVEPPVPWHIVDFASFRNRRSRIERAVQVVDQTGHAPRDERCVQLIRQRNRHLHRTDVPGRVRVARLGGQAEPREFLWNLARGMFADQHEGPAPLRAHHLHR